MLGEGTLREVEAFEEAIRPLSEIRRTLLAVLPVKEQMQTRGIAVGIILGDINVVVVFRVKGGALVDTSLAGVLGRLDRLGRCRANDKDE